MNRLLQMLAALVVFALGMWIWLGLDTDAPPPPADEAANQPAYEAVWAAPTQELEAGLAKFARIEMAPDTSYLTDEQRQVVNKLIAAAELMSKIYLRQVYDANPELRAEISASGLPQKDLLLEMFDLHFGVWDTLEAFAPFYGDTPYPEGAGFYPPDMTREEFEAWIAAHPEDEEAFRSPYTVIRRDGDSLVAIPYSEYYREWLEPAAMLLREAAEITTNESLEKFLRLRAKAFMSDDYFESELAWMDLDGPIEVVIGPYEVYTDRLFGTKTAFEAFVTLRNPEQSAALARYKQHLPDMERNLPVDEAYKNFRRSFDSPIAVTEQVHGGGDNVPGVQTIAFNLPNDERVREQKGAKKVMLKNVMDAKFDGILAPMADYVLVPEQAALLDRKYFFLEVVFHELSHSLGPGTITVDGRETTVNAELKELYSAMEEGKADAIGVYNLLYLMDEGELPVAEKENLLATYFTGLFRAMRWGLEEAHAEGAAFQYSFLKEQGAFAYDAEAGRYRIDFAALERALSELAARVVILQGDGDYEGTKAFLDQYALIDADAQAVIDSLAGVPVDIDPVYPPRI